MLALGGLRTVSSALGLVEDDGGYCASYALDFQNLILQEVSELFYASCRDDRDDIILPRHFVEFFHVRKLAEGFYDVIQGGRFDEDVYENQKS